MEIEHLFRYPPLAVGLMEIEHLFRYPPLAVGLKPSAIQGEARLRGLERIIYSKTISPRLSRAKPACAGESGLCIQRPSKYAYTVVTSLRRRIAETRRARSFRRAPHPKSCISPNYTTIRERCDGAALPSVGCAALCRRLTLLLQSCFILHLEHSLFPVIFSSPSNTNE
jgi:hypothetical protein